MQFISVIIRILRGTKSEVWGFRVIVSLSYFTSFASCDTTYFYRFGVYKELLFFSIHCHSNPFSYLLAQTCGTSPAVIKLSA